MGKNKTKRTYRRVERERMESFTFQAPASMKELVYNAAALAREPVSMWLRKVVARQFEAVTA